MAEARYQIQDDRPGGGYAVSPLWPLLALMLCGGWLAWPWMVANAYILESPTRRRELCWAIGGLLGSALLAIAILMWSAGAADDEAIVRRLRYALIALTVWKLVCGYRIYLLQVRTVELFQFYGGVLRNALPILLAGFLLREWVLNYVNVPFLRLALA